MTPDPSAPSAATDPLSRPAATSGPSTPNILYADPTYLAYMRNMGLSEQINTQHAADQYGQMAAQKSITDDQIQRNGADQRSSILGGAEANGMLGSSFTEANMARQQANESGQLAQTQYGLGSSLNDLEYQLAIQRLQSGVGASNLGASQAGAMYNQYVDPAVLAYLGRGY